MLAEGKTKQDYPKLSKGGRKKGCIPWNKGLTAKENSSVRKSIEGLIKSHIGKAPWNKGMTNLKEKYPNVGFQKGHKHWDNDNSKKTLFKKGDNSLEKHHNWKGGKSFEQYSTEWTKDLKNKIRHRDNYTCQLCNKVTENIIFDVHHIDYDKKNCSPDNLITLCKSCHMKTNFNRKEYLKAFNKIV